MISPTLAQHALPQRGLLANPLVRDMLLVLAGTLLMTLCARIAIPLPWTPIPFTMQTFGVLLLGALYGPRLGFITLVAYLAEALLGLPVLSFGRNAWAPDQLTGLPVIIGSTAGYLYALPLAAALVGALAQRGWDRTLRSALPAMLLGNMVILIGGFIWLFVATAMVRGSTNMVPLFDAAVLPFLPGDLFKLVLAAVALPGAWMLTNRQG